MKCSAFCEECNADGDVPRCTRCKAGFALPNGGAQCIPCATKNCVHGAACGDYYFSTDGQAVCIPKSEFCSNVGSAGICTACQTDYELVGYYYSARCVARIPRCIGYGVGNKCAECETGYFGLECRSCAPNCAYCDGINTCRRCLEGYALQRNKATGVMECKISNQGKCTKDQECLYQDECYNEVCGRRSDEECSENQDSGSAIDAKICSGRFKCINRSCHYDQDAINHCSVYYVDGLFCYQCASGYFISSDMRSCTICPPQCATCVYGGYCTSCLRASRQSVNGVCKTSQWVYYGLILGFFVLLWVVGGILFCAFGRKRVRFAVLNK